MLLLIPALSLMAAGPASAAAPPAPTAEAPGATLALFVLVVAVAGWIGLRTLVRRLRAGKAAAAVGSNFVEYALEALVNAAKIDGRVSDEEKRAIARAMSDIQGDACEASAVERAFARARLSKNELVAYLAARAHAFSRDQKMTLLKGLMAVFVADGRFDEIEHAALVDYTAAVGFDRKSAPDVLRGLSRTLVRGNIT